MYVLVNPQVISHLEVVRVVSENPSRKTNRRLHGWRNNDISIVEARGINLNVAPAQQNVNIASLPSVRSTTSWMERKLRVIRKLLSVKKQSWETFTTQETNVKGLIIWTAPRKVYQCW